MKIVAEKHAAKFEGWKAIGTASTIHFAAKGYNGHAQGVLNALHIPIDLQNYQMPRFASMQEMQDWLNEPETQLESEDTLEVKLEKALLKSFRDKVAKIHASLSTILQKLDIAESSPLSLDHRSMRAISDLSGKLANLKTYFQAEFLENLLKRHAELVEIFEIRLDSEAKQSSKNGSHLERKMSYYTSIKNALENRGKKSLHDSLTAKIDALNSAQIISQWSEEALTGIKAILRVEVKHLIEDKEGMLQEASNWKNQASTRQLKLEDINKLDRDVLDSVKGQLLTVIDLAGQISQKIEDNQDTEKESKIAVFHQKEELIANRLQNILLALQGIKIEGSSLAAIEKASSNVERILDDCEELEKEKNEYVSLGNTIKDYHKGVDSIKDICLKWERVTNLLRDQKIKSQSLIQMWNQSELLKSSFEMDMQKFKDTFPDDPEEKVENQEKLHDLLDEQKSSIDVLRKMRHNFEMFFKCQKQLIHEMQTVPSFDTNHLKKELMKIQQSYAELCTAQKEKLFTVNKLVSTWESIQKEMNLLHDLGFQLQNPGCNLSKITQEISNLSQHAEKVIESLETEVLSKVNFKIPFIHETLPAFKEKLRVLMKESADQDAIENLLSNTQNVDKCMVNAQHLVNQPYKDFKSHMTVLNTLKETFDKIHSVITLKIGTTFELYHQNFVQKCQIVSKEILANLKPIEDMNLVTFSEAKCDASSLQGLMTIIKSILVQESQMLKSFHQLELKSETDQRIKELETVYEAIKSIEKLLPRLKTLTVEELETCNKDIQIFSPENLAWSEIINNLTFKISAVINEAIEKEQNSAVGKTLTNLESELNESLEISDFMIKYGKLSSICWKLPRSSEISEDSSFALDKMNAIFEKLVKIMETDLTTMHGSITQPWLQSWLHSSTEEMCLGEPFTDVTQVVQSLDQTLILLNSVTYAILCINCHTKWTSQLDQIKSDLSKAKGDDWIEFVSRAENELSAIFDQVATKPHQPDEVVMLSTVDEMTSSLEKEMGLFRQLLAKLRYFEEKAHELMTSVDSVQEIDQLNRAYEEIKSKVDSLNQIGLEIPELAPKLINICVIELMSEVELKIAEKKSAFQLVIDVTERTNQIKSLGIYDEDFESVARQLLEDLNDINTKLSENQSEQIQYCLDEVTSLLEEYEASENLNADMLEIAQLHEELTIWLKDVEDALQKSLDLKCSLDDKRKQLEEYHEIHNDIEAHEKLVSMVFEKTSKLMTQTNDFSLSTYLTSIQSLFETIKLKSSKLIQQMGECIQDQEDYEERLITFTDFLTQQAHYLKEVLSVRSQDPEFDVKSALLVLAQRLEDGNGMLMDLEDALADVLASTSDDGRENLENEFKLISDMWTKHLKQIHDLKGSLGPIHIY